MDHVVFVDTKEKELEKLLEGAKKMIVRGAAGRKLPHGRVSSGDRLFFMQNNGEGLVRASAEVVSAFSSEKLSEAECNALLEANQNALQLSASQHKRWGGKRYLVLIEVGQVSPLTPFSIDRSRFSSMDDWLPVEDIERVTIR